MSEPREDEIKWCSPMLGEGGSKTPLSQKHRHQWAGRRKAAEEQAERQGVPAEQFENWSGTQVHRDVQRCHTVRGEDGDPLRGALWYTHPHACIYEPYREAGDNEDAREQMGYWLP